MKITKTCMLTRQVNTLDIDVTQEQLDRINNRHSTGEYIQDIVPHLSSAHREFLMTGICDDIWNIVFPKEHVDE